MSAGGSERWSFRLFGEERFELGGELGIFLGEVFGFPFRGGVVVEFEVAVAVLDEAVSGGADGAGLVVVGNGVAF